MLRITRFDQEDSETSLKLEGKLVGPWVEELRRVYQAEGSRPGSLRLDLSAVTFVDEEGLGLLREVLQYGAQLTSCSGLVAELLHRENR